MLKVLGIAGITLFGFCLPDLMLARSGCERPNAPLNLCLALGVSFLEISTYFIFG